MGLIDDAFLQRSCDRAAANFWRISNTDYYYSEIVRDTCHAIAQKFFSTDWLIKHFYSDLTVDPNYITQSTFLPLKVNLARYSLIFHRLRTFAECLVNFQGIEGFNAQLKDFNNNSRGGLPHTFTSGYAELLAARYIFLADIQFRFVARSGKSKSDFDMEAIIGGHKVAVEVKAKTNGNNFDEKSFWDVINKAASQSDMDAEKLVFVGVPEEWSNHPDFHRLISITNEVTKKIEINSARFLLGERAWSL